VRPYRDVDNADARERREAPSTSRMGLYQGEATPTVQSMSLTEVEDWFEGQPLQRQREWLAIRPPKFRIPENLVFTVPAEYRESWLLVTYLGFGDSTVSWFPAGPLARLLIARRADPGDSPFATRPH